jgi:transcriptional regulator of acetoin/glycerol metabolism
MIGKSIELLNPKDRPGEIIAVTAKVIAGQPVEHFETMRVRKGGTLVAVSQNVSPIRDAGGAVVGISVVSRDVTDQMEAKRAIAERQARELDRLVELERFQRLTVGRELKMIELKKEIEYLRKLGSSMAREPDHEG